MQQNAQLQGVQPRYGVYLVEARSAQKLPEGQFATTLTYLRPEYKHVGEPHFPVLELGSLVAMCQQDICTHVGMMTEVPDAADTISGIVDWWELDEDVSFKVLAQQKGSLSLYPMTHLFRVETDRKSFDCNLRPLSAANAERLRAELLPVVPKVLRNIFWSEQEIAQLEAEASAQNQYQERAQALIDSMYS
jgi:hypothetical protein